ncbi:glycerate kinase [Paenibacillus thermoaerophilus]|uniref:Glycerate kinase n=1 Tax=Paenibacillus thermoaerophilus TaxID=1215385 RepID=A0ABW2V487_9BACL|nr:glycerate kinase [Paenibacillus thermoaerophilus]TMV13892.1 glycerate kinase [Paenibacillus thermoaerophilus]
MKIIVAPDSFKGSLSAIQICAAIRAGIQRVEPDADIMEMPVADGGEGTVEGMLHACGGTLVKANVSGPLGEPVNAAYGILPDGTAIIETAAASGLPLVSAEDRNPLIASTYGTGELIADALNRGCRKFIIGLGGSATNDGGTGLLEALGVRFYDADGDPLSRGGGELRRLASFDMTGIDPRIRESSFVLATDVTNPLCGPDGAAAVFAPQKGATPEMIEVLEAGLLRFAEVIRNGLNLDVLSVPGGGAAGGMGAGLYAFLKAALQPGIDILMEKADFRNRLADADLVITGEGKLDRQTLSGKVIAGICREAKQAGVPVIALCGGMELSAEQMDQIGLTAGFSIVQRPCSLQEAFQHTAEWVEQTASQVLRVTRMKGFVK